MSIWEVILYSIFGGITELLPLSFGGHAALLRNAFHFSALDTAEGCYIRLGICIGTFFSIILAFREESRLLGKEVLLLTGLKKRKRRELPDKKYFRSIILGFFALLPMLLSLIFLATAERMNSLPIVAGFFALNGLVVYFACKSTVGQKDETTVLLSDTFFIGLGRMLSIFPGLSSLGTSMCIGRARGLGLRYNLRLGYMLSLLFFGASLIYYLIRALLYGSFSFTVLLLLLLAALIACIFGYLAIQYFRYLLEKKKLYVFSYYCWDAAVVALLLALLNA